MNNCWSKEDKEKFVDEIDLNQRPKQGEESGWGPILAG